jgi:hypothetical protein
MKKIIVYFVAFLTFLDLSAQINLIKPENFLPKYGNNFEYFLNYVGKNSDNYFFKGEANYINNKKYKASIYYQANFESNKVDIISLTDYSILNDIVVNEYLKVYTSERSNLKDPNKIMNINLLKFEQISNKPEKINIHQFNFGEYKKDCKAHVFSSFSPDKQKIGFILLVFDENNYLYNIQGAIFNQMDELIWSQTIQIKDPSLLNKFENFSLTNDGKINIIISQFDKFISPFYIKNHIIYTIDGNKFDQKIIETNSAKVVSSDLKFLTNGDIIFLDNIKINKNSNDAFELIKYRLESKTIVRNIISFPNQEQINTYVYSFKKNIKEYIFDFIDIHENANNELYLIFQDLNISSSAISENYFTRNIYIHKFSEDFSEHNRITIPHSLFFKTEISSKEFTGMSKIYSYCINSDLYLAYNENVNNFKAKKFNIWFINDDVFGENNRIVLTHIDPQLNFETFCSTEALNSTITLKQTLFNFENKIFFATDKHAIGFIEF